MPHHASPALEKAKSLIRRQVRFYDHDRYFAPDIQRVVEMVREGQFNGFSPGGLMTSF
jgi:histidine ammonia-lyase